LRRLSISRFAVDVGFHRYGAALSIRSAGANKRMKDKADHACRALCRARVAEELRRRRGMRIGVHLKLVLSVLDRQEH
jgi:hypothetical protein